MGQGVDSTVADDLGTAHAAPVRKRAGRAGVTGPPAGDGEPLLASAAQPRDGAAARREPSEATPVACTRQGRRWRVAWGHRSVLVEHSVGLFHLAVLMANPGQEIPAIDLVAGVAAIGGSTGSNGLSAQPVLDHLANHEYRRRLSQLRAEIDESESAGDGECSGRACAEREWLLAELAGATAIGGRRRRFTDNRERARIAVGKAIRRALTRIEEADAVIGQHLRGTIYTGTRCSYWPA